MNEQVPFTIRGRNPDVLTCIANLSNDEVFTPPEFANRMLDTLAEAWADSNNGESIWANSSVRFLDPFVKSGVFLREITSRLIAGLATEIPDLQTRVDHILTNQVFGIGITTLTSLLARRSLYCSKFANGEHSVAKSITTETGNVWFERTEHTWQGAKCKFCNAQREKFTRDEGLESHAYPFIHTDDIVARVSEWFGGRMQFDVIIGNPPYQMTGGAGGTSDSSIYHLFVEQALNLDARFVSMIIPSRWLAGGRGMDEFRKQMLTDGHLSHLVDYTKMSTAFPGVDFEGGVQYFLYDSKYSGKCEYTLFQGETEYPAVKRNLGAHDIFIRDHFAVGILEKVLSRKEPSISEILTNREPFKMESNFREFNKTKKDGEISIHYTDKGKRGIGFIARDRIEKNVNLIDKWKVFVPKAYGERGAIPSMVLGKPMVSGPASVCTGSYLFFYCDSEQEAKCIMTYYSTKFFRFLVSLRKITQDAFRSMYSWVPQQAWDEIWTDEILYQKYGLNTAEIEYIEAVIRPMDIGVED